MSAEIINLYETMPSRYQTARRKYKNYKRLKIDLNSRILLVGSSGSGKTTIAVNLIRLFGCFDKVWIFAKNLAEPLYAWLIDWFAKIEKRCKRQILMYSNDENEIPDVDHFDPHYTHLVIFDDMVTVGNAAKKKISDLWIRSRKQNCTCMFLSQNYTSIPQIIRRNSDYVILKKINTKRDLRFILSEYNLGLDLADLEAIYKYATRKGLTSFLMIDLNGPEEQRFRANFTPIYSSSSSSSSSSL